MGLWVGALVVCDHSDKVDDRSYFDNEDLIFSICHVTLSDHRFIKLRDCIDGSPTRQVTTLPCFVAIGLV